MSKYRKKPVEIEARLVTHETANEVAAWCGGTPGWAKFAAPGEQIMTPESFMGIHIPTLEGVMHASPGDWVIRGVSGEHYPCSRPLGVEPGSVVTAWRAAQIVAAATHGAHLVGAVPSFDAEVLAALLRDNYLTPAWHHHLIDVETLTVGYLAGFHERKPDVVGAVAPPWRSDDLSSLIGVTPPDGDARHTALGDALWARSMYDHIMGGNE